MHGDDLAYEGKTEAARIEFKPVAFAGTGLPGLSKLSLGWMKPGIVP
jgi:hypothetical protein